MKYKVKNAMWILVVIIEVFPFLESILLSSASADDFAMAIKSDYLINSIKHANEMFFSWGGNWPVVFVEGLLNPLNYFGADKFAYGAVLVGFFCVFIAVLYFFIKWIVIWICSVDNSLENQKKVRWLYCIVLFSVLNTNIYPEIYYWFIGNSYLWGAIMMLVVMANIILLFYKTESIGRIVLLSLIGFVSCFSYQYAVSIGLLYLIIAYDYHYGYKKAIGFKHFIPLVCMIAGGLISVLAPGNYARHYVIDPNGLNIPKAIYMSIYNFFTIVIDLIINPVFVFTMLVIFIIGTCMQRGRKVVIHPLVFFVTGAIALEGVLFPIALGYSGGHIPNRAFFMSNFFTILWSSLGSLYLGVWIREKKEIMNEFDFRLNVEIVISLILAILIIGFQQDGKGDVTFSSLPYIRISKEMTVIADERKYYIGILKEIENSSQKEIVIRQKKENIPRQTGIIKSIDLAEDPTYFVNDAVAKWYGKESVKYILE